MVLDKINSFDDVYNETVPYAVDYYNKRKNQQATNEDLILFSEKLNNLLKITYLDSGNTSHIAYYTHLVVSNRSAEIRFFTRTHTKKEVKNYIEELKTKFN